MGWKPKEKQLTAEEAIALAKKELKPFWIGSPPLLVGLINKGRASVHPLDPKFSDRNWLVLLTDPTTFGGEGAIATLKEWHRRYRTHSLEFLLFLRFPDAELFTRNAVDEQLIQNHELEFPIAVDPDGAIFAAFNVDLTPTILLFRQGRLVFQFSGHSWAQEGEARLQTFLRATDPGLPLFPIVKSRNQLPRDHEILSFSAPLSEQIVFQDLDATLVPHDKICISGKWLSEPGKITTSDPSATIRFRCPGKSFALLAKTQKQSGETGNIIVQVNEMPVFENFFGSELQRDTDGTTFIQISNRWLYHVLADLPESDRLITLKFPGAAKNSASLYGLRFGV